MAEYTNDHVEEIEEQLPEGIQIDGIGDIHHEGVDDVKVPLMENGEPYPAHVPPEDLDYPDTGTENEDDGSYEEVWDWDDDDDDDDEDDEEATATESDYPHYPQDRFSNFAGVSAALLDGVLCSILSKESIRELEFGTHFGDVGAFLSIKIER